MDLTKLWAENKKTIITTAIVVIVALLIIKFFNYIFLAGIVVALAVAAVLGWNYLSKKHGGTAGVWKAFLKSFEGE
jgi:hypothetical protein